MCICVHVFRHLCTHKHLHCVHFGCMPRFDAYNKEGQSTFRVETTTAIITEGSSQPTTSSGGSESDASFMRLLQTNTNASSTELPSNEESSLNELVSKIIVTDDKVAKVVKAMQAEQISPPQRPGEEQTVEDSFSLYMKLIKPLQFSKFHKSDFMR